MMVDNISTVNWSVCNLSREIFGWKGIPLCISFHYAPCVRIDLCSVVIIDVKQANVMSLINKNRDFHYPLVLLELIGLYVTKLAS